MSDGTAVDSAGAIGWLKAFASTSTAAVVLCLVGLIGYVVLRLRELRSGGDHRPRRITAVVLGDLARSPRTVRQVVELHRDGWEVTLIGYGRSIAEVKEIVPSGVQVKLISTGFLVRGNVAAVYLLRAVFASGWRALCLLKMLIVCKRQGVFLVQNPPCIPTFACVFLAAWFFHGRAAVVIDWHNLAYTVMQSSGNVPPVAVTIAHWYERQLGALADVHLTVSQALADFLRAEFHVHHATVLYDRPNEVFQTAAVAAAALSSPLPLPPPPPGGGKEESSADRSCRSPASEVLQSLGLEEDFRGESDVLLVSSTSWTPDEDFSVLLEALQLVDREIAASARQPDRITVLITGRGPLREDFERRVAQLALQRVAVRTAWLSYRDYATVLGAAAFGISLHVSSSGLDLPMKVVDMLGVGLPVVSPSYLCIEELVVPGKNGLLFRSAEELKAAVLSLLEDWPRGRRLETMQANARRWFEGSDWRWRTTWRRVARPVFSQLLLRRSLS